jgi:hypothetical protein
MIATAIVVGITLHAGNHLACDFPRVIAARPDEYALVAGAFGAAKPTYASLLSGAAGVTGVAMVVLMTVSFTLATHPFRKGEPKGGAAAVTSRLPAPLNRLTGFNAFWYSHHLLGIVYALLVVHGFFLFLVNRWYEKTVRTHKYRYLIPAAITTTTTTTTCRRLESSRLSEGDWRVSAPPVRSGGGKGDDALMRRARLCFSATRPLLLLLLLLYLCCLLLETAPC